ncbi:ADP-ribose pyrophosphatase YjhB, NUDIX family [Halobacillus dabanensis]|uniref:ADP-ribose pyrophosphatase YjhB, NUDIX family n=1 Tax=Halobacillus dabanensis TaxID=240302 RepID=A0A1I3WRN9_HALDA|nr:NUDIX hydrolase [Halobacillus dabanensis]SFK10175.1 ADP-ribose pyrophosphatase YjhB, NUDIX family [Halobacillus dabanensis]
MARDVRFKVGGQRFNYRAAAIMIEKGHVLLHRQVDDSFWALPGGGIELGEASEETVVREMKEELGYDVEVVRTVWIAETFFKHRGDAMHEVAFYYLLNTRDSLFKDGSFEGLEGERLIYQWIPIDVLEDIELKPAFLGKGLKNVPCETMHLVRKD